MTISHNLSWSTHIAGIIGRATSALAFFRRNFNQCSRDVKIKCYLTYIRPIIEYAVVIWSPHLQNNIKLKWYKERPLDLYLIIILDIRVLQIC